MVMAMIRVQRKHLNIGDVIALPLYRNLVLRFSDEENLRSKNRCRVARLRIGRSR
jgi:hypothetical protein